MNTDTKVKNMRVLRNMKASDLAKELKLTRAAVCDAEHRGIKQVSTAKRYAAALHCKPEDLLEF